MGNRRVRILGSLVLGNIGWLLISATAANAGTYTIRACDNAGAGPNNAWTSSQLSGQYATGYAVDSCGAASGTLRAVVQGNVYQAAATRTQKASAIGGGIVANASWSFRAPSGASIASWSASQICAVTSPFVGSPVPVGCNRTTWVTGTSTPAAGTTYASFTASCKGSTCQGKSGSMSARNLTVTVSDSTSPSVSLTGGSVLGDAAVTGSGDVRIDAADNVGIRSARVFVDGVGQVTTSFTCDYTKPAPCSDVTGATLTVTTATLADGVHEIEVEVEDAAGNRTRSSGEPFESYNGSPSSNGGTWATLATGESMLLGDVTGDGAADLATYTSSTGKLSVRASNGSTAFGAATTWGTWASATALRLGDVDADGDDDLMARPSGSSAIQVRRSSTAAFDAATTWLASGTGQPSLADADGDAASDLMLVDGSTVRGAWAVDGTFEELGTWVSGLTASPSFGDVDGDGAEDLVLFDSASGAVRVRRSDGAEFGALESWGTAPAGCQLRVADVDGDERVDLMVRDSAGRLSYSASTGSAFATAKAWGQLLQTDEWDVVDVNADLRGDVVSRSGTAVSVLLGGVQYPMGDTTTWQPGPDEPEDPDDDVQTLAEGPPPMKLGWADNFEFIDTNPGPVEANDRIALALDRVQQTGSRFVRLQVLWGSYQTDTGYKGRVLNAIRRARLRNLLVLVTLTGYADDRTGISHHVNPDPADFAVFVDQAVRDMAPLGVRHYSLWNEPQLKTWLRVYCPSHPSRRVSTANLYRELYDAGYDAAKDAQSDAYIYVGELSEQNSPGRPSCSDNDRGRHKSLSTRQYLELLTREDEALVTHGVTWHAYQHRSGPKHDSRGIGISDTADMQRRISSLYVRQSNGIRRMRTPDSNRPKLWITEFGYFNVPFPNRNSPTYWTEGTRGLWLRQALSRALSNNVRLFVFWNLSERMDDAADYDGEDGETGKKPPFDTGMLGRSDLNPRDVRHYGKGTTRGTINNDNPREAYCRVQQWASDRHYAVRAAGC